MNSNESVESLKVNGVCINEKEGMKNAIKEPWERIRGVDEVSDVREESITLETKDAEELNEKIRTEEVVNCVKGQKNCKAAQDRMKYRTRCRRMEGKW